MIVDLNAAVRLVENGEPVAVPTETVYGLAADAFNVRAVRKTFELKGRPADNPLIVHISDAGMLDLLAVDIPEDARRLAEKYWPGPLSIILKKRPELPDIATGGLETVAVRMPAHKQTLKLIRMTGPLTAPSANRSGKPSSTRIQHIVDDYGSDLPVLEGESPGIGIESTVLDITTSPYLVLRPGVITADELETFLDVPVKQGNTHTDIDRQKRSPGSRYTHYKPEADVKWIEELPSEADYENRYLILHSRLFLNVSKPNVYHYNGNFKALARDLYDHFREADRLSCSSVLIEVLPDDEKHALIPALRNRIDKATGR